MILWLIAFICIAQVGVYLCLDFLKIRFPKWLLLLLFLAVHLLVFPSFFQPELPQGEIHCGLPSLGITLAFWVFGCGGVIMAHAVYVLINRSKPN